MDVKVATIDEEYQNDFDAQVNRYLRDFDVIDIAFCTSVAPYEGTIRRIFIAHIQYTEKKIDMGGGRFH